MSRIASSSLAPSQCTCLPKWVTKVPSRIGTVLAGSNLLPEPTHQVPLSTVMKRSLGWKCGRLKLLPARPLLMTRYRPGCGFAAGALPFDLVGQLEDHGFRIELGRARRADRQHHGADRDGGAGPREPGRLC